MLNQFTRTELVAGEKNIRRFQSARVALFGVGGVGGFAMEALVRSGIGAIDLIDNDTVSLTNLNRQIIATHDTIGRAKVDVAEERIRSINPDCVVRKYQCFFLPETADRFDFTQYDYVIDAVDTVQAKLELVMRCKAAGTPIISAMGAGNKLDPTRFQVADISRTSVDPLAKVMRQQLRKRGVKHLKVVYYQEMPAKPLTAAYLTEQGRGGDLTEQARETGSLRLSPGSTAFVPSVVGLIIASEVVRDLMEEPLPQDRIQATIDTLHEGGADPA